MAFLRLVPSVVRHTAYERIMSDEESYKRLHKLCYNLYLGQASLDDIQQWLNDNEGDTELLVKAANHQNECKNTPLHCLVCKGPSLDLVKQLLHHAPDAVKVQNKVGQTPLHAACYFKASPDLTRMLFTAYPEAALIKDNNASLPIHFACDTTTGPMKLETLNLLISANPKCLGEKDGEDMLPSDYIEEYDGDDAPFLLHRAIDGRLSVPFVKLLIQIFPESCVAQDDKGMIPLHYACASKAPHFLEYVMLLLDANNKDSLTIQDNWGRTPMQVLSITVSNPDKNGMLPLHRLAATSNELSERSLRLLVDTFAGSISTEDKYGMLPFHHACLNQEASIEVLMLFIEMSPDIIKSV